MAKYWEKEQPIEIVTTRNELRWYPGAKQLAVCRLPFTDDSGVVRQGKTTTLNVSALGESDVETMEAARAIFAEISEYLDLRLSVQ